MLKKLVLMVVAGMLSVAWSMVVFAKGTEVTLKEVVVTATKTEKSPQDVTQSVTVITADEIKKSGVSNAAEAVNRSVDVNFQEYGPRGSTANISMRGSTAPQVLILLDGIRLNSPRDGGFSLTDLPVALGDIERIEVVRGPSSALYGADAVGGVVNIITKRPEENRTSFSASAGSHGYDSLSANQSGRTGGLYYSLTAGRETSDGYRPNSDLSQYTAGGKIGYELSKDSSVELTANHIAKGIGVPGSTDWTTPFARQGTRNALTGAGYRTKLSQDLEVKINAHYNTDTLTFSPDLTTPASRHTSYSEGADAQINWLINAWNAVTVGAEAKGDRVKSADSGDHSTRLLAGYLQDEIGIGEQFLVLLGGRYDDHSVYASQFSPKMSARYIVASTNTVIRASAGKSFRAPTFNDLYWKDVYGNIGNPNLKPETAKEYEAGIEQPLGKKAGMKLTGFTRRVKDLVDWQQIAPFVYQPKNIGRANIRGVEAEATAAPFEGFTVAMNYTYMKPINELNGEKIYRIPEQQFKGWFDLTVATNTTVHLEDRMVKNYLRPNEDTWHYSTVDAKITQKVVSRERVKGDVFIGINNIFDRKYSVTRTYSFFTGAHSGDYPMPPRELVAGVNVQF